MPNIRTFRYTDVFATTGTDKWYKVSTNTYPTETDFTDASKAAVKFSLKANDFFIVEIDHSTFVKSLTPLIA
jgi:hypothetical protein